MSVWSTVAYELTSLSVKDSTGFLVRVVAVAKLKLGGVDVSNIYATGVAAYHGKHGVNVSGSEEFAGSGRCRSVSHGRLMTVVWVIL